MVLDNNISVGENMTPKEVVSYLDQYVIGQQEAKTAVAIALRNRWRRRHVSSDMMSNIYPNNLIMIGPTGVGKTEIARRLAKMVGAPFIKVEATKFTEVGYVGRDVDSIIRELMDVAVSITKENMRSSVAAKASSIIEGKILDALVGKRSSDETRSEFEAKLRNGHLEDVEIEIEVSDTQNPQGAFMDIPGMPGGQMGMVNVGDIIGKMMGNAKKKLMKLCVSEARKLLLKEESDKLIDEEKMVQQAIHLVENYGIVFLDEIDKICSRNQDSGTRGEVSREGVQRDLLPLVEGSVVSTKYGAVKTDHILFIASGAFHLAKPSDLLPELQGRFPIRVQLHPLSEKDLVKILTEPKHSLIKQYVAMFAVENVNVVFAESGVEAIANLAALFNTEVENIGARRLHTILEKLLESLNFTASETPGIEVMIDDEYVKKYLGDLNINVDLNKFIL